MKAMNTRLPIKSLLWGSVLLAPFHVGDLVATDHERNWTGAVNEFFSEAGNWVPATVPGDTNTAVFDTVGDFTVDFTGAGPMIDNSQLLVRDGNLLFHIPDGTTYRLMGSTNPRIDIGFAEPRDFHLSGGGNLYSHGETTIGLPGSGETTRVIVENATLESNGRFYIGAFANAPAYQGELLILGGGLVRVTNRLSVGRGRGTGSVLVSGTDARLQMVGNSLDLGIGAWNHSSEGSLLVEKGGEFDTNHEVLLGSSGGSASTGRLVVRGPGSHMAMTASNRDLVLGDDGNAASLGIFRIEDSATASIASNVIIGADQGTGLFTVGDGAVVEVESHIYLAADAASSGTLQIRVWGDDMLKIGGDLHIGDGNATVQIVASPASATGFYTPIDGGGVWNQSVLHSVGGIWDNGTFEISTSESGAPGVSTEVDLSQWQRLEISTGTETLLVSFDSNAQSDDANPLSFQADFNPVEFVGGWEVLGAWDINTNISSDYETMLSMEIGPGFNPDLLEIWHYNGTDWTLFDASLFYEGQTWASFLTNDFSSYAIVHIPEPSTELLLLLAGGAWLLRRRDRR